MEAEYGGPIDWQRMETKRATRITVAFPGGWADESTWIDVIPKVVAAMEKLHKVLARRAVAAKEAS